MAEKDKLDLELEPETESPMKKMILIIVGTMLVTLILVFTTLYFMGIFPPKTEAPAAAGEASEETAEGEAAEESEDHGKHDKKKHDKKGETEEAHPPSYESLDSFTITYKNSSEIRVVQLGVTVMVADPAIAEAVKKHKPMIRNNLLLMLAAQDPVALKSVEGKAALQIRIKAEIDAILKKQIKEKNAIEGVYFTSFIMQ
jgi:flagellar FliL protein